MNKPFKVVLAATFVQFGLGALAQSSIPVPHGFIQRAYQTAAAGLVQTAEAAATVPSGNASDAPRVTPVTTMPEDIKDRTSPPDPISELAKQQGFKFEDGRYRNKDGEPQLSSLPPAAIRALIWRINSDANQTRRAAWKQNRRSGKPASMACTLLEDASSDVLLVAVAIAEGTMAGVAINRRLLAAEGLL